MFPPYQFTLSRNKHINIQIYIGNTTDKYNTIECSIYNTIAKWPILYSTQESNFFKRTETLKIIYRLIMRISKPNILTDYIVFLNSLSSKKFFFIFPIDYNM